MSTITVFEHKQVTVWYDPDKNILHNQIHEYTYGDVFRQFLMAVVDAMTHYRTTKVLSDDRKNPVLHPDDQKWAREMWEPKMIEAGWKYWAIVQPERMIANMRMIKFAERLLHLGIIVELFDDVEDAMRWLERQE